MRSAFVVHIYYEELALEIIEQIARLRLSDDLFLTGPATTAASVRSALQKLENNCEVIASTNRGRDVGPFLDVLPILIERGYDLFCKLHTKAGGSGYAREWFDACLKTLVGSKESIARIMQAFAQERTLCNLGPSPFYVSASRHMLGNAENVKRLIRICFPGHPLPADWGFFAGTMFWGRTEFFRPFTHLKDYGAEFTRDNDAGDGELEHALERAFGLPATVKKSLVGMISIDGALSIGQASATVSQEMLLERLALLKQEARRRLPVPHREELSRLQNPLVHYLKSDAKVAFDPNPYFHNAWYARDNPEVMQQEITALQHYIRTGARQRRNPSPIFDARYYLSKHPNIAWFGENPLSHFLQHGQHLGYRTRGSGALKALQLWYGPARLYRTFDEGQQRSFLRALQSMPEALRRESGNSLVTVILPVLNEGPELDDAIESVRRQTHRNFELLLVSAGTPQMFLDRIISHHDDPRIKLVPSPIGVNAARNAGLKSASGIFIAYLDAQCRWHPSFLERMISWMTLEDLRSAYCVSKICDSGRTCGYWGEQFGRTASTQANHVDLNGFCHRKALYDEQGGFDERAEFSSSDLIRRYSEKDQMAFAPFVGCEYERLAFSIKADSPRGPGGLSAFAQSLLEGMHQLGYAARIDHRGEWYSKEFCPNEVVIVLRESLAYEPRIGQFSVLWILDNLADISFDELETFDLVVAGSENDATFLRAVVAVPVMCLSAAFKAQKSLPAQSSAESHHVNSQVHEILSNIHQLFGLRPGDARDYPKPQMFSVGTSRRGWRIHVIHRVGGNATQSSSYIRLISPLTCAAASDVRLSISGENSIDGATESDVCIVSRGALDDGEKVSLLLERAQKSGTRLIVDNDDAFGLIEPTDPYFETFVQRNDSMKRLMQGADQCWFSTAPLADLYRPCCPTVETIPNTLDRRIWSIPPLSPNFGPVDCLRLLYMGTARHGEDLALIMPALDAVSRKNPNKFELTIVGVTNSVPIRPWLRVLSWPASATIYPRFVRWLIRQGPFDIGLAPLTRTPFNDCKSDIKFLDYSAMGMLSVVSDAPAYAGEAKSQQLAIVVENTAEAWANALERIFVDRPQYAAMAVAAHRYVWQERDVTLAANSEILALENLS